MAVAELLAARTGLSGRVRYAVGDLLDLRFPPARFDLVWTQHAVMNIADRDALYAGLRRALRPGGRLAFHDVLATEGEAPLYPTPWAETAAASHLLGEADTLSALGRAGLTLVTLRDVTSQTVAAMAAAGPPPPPPASGLGRIMGPRFAAMAANREGRLRVVMGIAERKP